MKCWKCNKEMNNLRGDYTLKGVEVTVSLKGMQRTPENIEYINEQLGKYTDDNGGCKVAICYECYIDNLFSGYAVVQHIPIVKKQIKEEP